MEARTPTISLFSLSCVLAESDGGRGGEGVEGVGLEELCRAVGEGYFKSCVSRYKRAYRSLGPDFGKFLINLDGVLEALKHSNQGYVLTPVTHAHHHHHRHTHFTNCFNHCH
jgi:hypothetical protein